MQDVNRFVYFLKPIEFMSNVFFNRPFTCQSFVDQLWYIIITLPSSESRTNPFTACNKIYRMGLDKLLSLSNSNNTAASETSTWGLKSFSHDDCISSCIKTVSYSPLLIFKNKSFCTFLWCRFITNICSKLLSCLEFLLININSIDFGSSFDFRSLDYRQSYST